jgi:hypothetical protein
MPWSRLRYRQPTTRTSLRLVWGATAHPIVSTNWVVVGTTPYVDVEAACSALSPAVRLNQTVSFVLELVGVIPSHR